MIAHAEDDGDDGAEPASAGKRYDRFRDRIMFPIRSVQGAVIGFGGRVLDRGEPKYLNSPETPVFSKGRELYGLFEARTAIRQRGYALVVEGYMDVVALAQSGFGNAVATLGTACTAEHVQKLVRFTDAVVFSFDGDAAGRRAAGRALEASLPHASDTRSFRFLFLPPEHDPDSFVRELGAAAFEQARRRGGAAVAPDRRARRRGRRPGDRRGPGALPGQRPAALDGPARRHAEAPAARRDRLAGGAADRRARRRLARGRGARGAARRAGGRRRAGRAAAARPAMRQPADRIAWMLLLESRWWDGLSGRRPRPALRPARLARRAVPLPRPRGRRARAAALGGAARARSPASPGPRSALALVDAEDPAIEPVARRPGALDRPAAHRPTEAGTTAMRVLGPDLTRAVPSRRCIIEGLRDRGNVTAAPPGPGHPLNEGHPPRPPFPARAAARVGV